MEIRDKIYASNEDKFVVLKLPFATEGRVDWSVGCCRLNETDVKLTAFHSFFWVDFWLFYLPGEPYQLHIQCSP